MDSTNESFLFRVKVLRGSWGVAFGDLTSADSSKRDDIMARVASSCVRRAS
ncbi:hypothetical protein ABZ892_15650 [Streptomyces sp. NPDC046924]|uniref:hypothetical protein n=1 Tax=Streptomyces sp. NPDC046924 TaxID=3155136 RepID=UPI0033DADB58